MGGPQGPQADPLPARETPVNYFLAKSLSVAFALACSLSFRSCIEVAPCNKAFFDDLLFPSGVTG